MLTPPHPCGYFAAREARTALLDVRVPHAAAYAPLARAGFRRMGEGLYRPACVPVRVAVDRFRRVLRNNDDLSLRLAAAAPSDPRYALYARYIEGRHADGGMHPPSLDDYRSFFSAWAETVLLEAWLDGALVAAAIADVLDDGMAAVYAFFDPDLPERSLGVFSILQQVAECRRRRLPYLYGLLDRRGTQDALQDGLPAGADVH